MCIRDSLVALRLGIVRQNRLGPAVAGRVVCPRENSVQDSLGLSVGGPQQELLRTAHSSKAARKSTWW
eukprot:8007661-Alexandrium_andersonii.AAC.1